jgi:LysM repeat protein
MPTLAFLLPRVTAIQSTVSTPTPRTYTVLKNDMLGPIASRFGISVDALMAANPGVQPELLRIGQVLIIPGAAIPTTSSIAAAPIGVQIGPARCFPQSSGAVWCLALATNPTSEPATNISVSLIIFGNPPQAALAEQTIELPLRFLQAGESIALAAFFSPAEAKGILASAQIRTAVASTADMLIPVEITRKDSVAREDGIEVTVDFRIGAGKLPVLHRMDAVLTVLDAQGMPIGMRVYRQTGEWRPGQEDQLRMRAFTLGGTAVSYQISLEAHP